MAIVFDCPFCQREYQVMDDLAGRTALCQNPACRQKFVIPNPNISDDTPMPGTPPERED